VTAVRNFAAIECVARTDASEVVGTDVRDVNLDGACGFVDREGAIKLQAS